MSCWLASLGGPQFPFRARVLGYTAWTHRLAWEWLGEKRGEVKGEARANPGAEEARGEESR